jgi:8-oxo-dGTP pyrophosphatase MutT (NUDIX family)
MGLNASPAPTDAAFQPEGFLARARRLSLDLPPSALDPLVVPVEGDHRLAPGLPPAALHRPAAVLIPVVTRSDGATVLLAQRAAHLRDHSGQIAFPGGKIDPADPSPVATALREAEEEIGLSEGFVTPLGYLDPYLSSTGFRILPVVAAVDTGYGLTLNPAEVDAAFEVPLGFLMSPRNHLRHAREWKGSLRHFYAMPFEDRYIWGVTAGILRNLYERLYVP